AGLEGPAAAGEADHGRRRRDVDARLAAAGISEPRQLRRIQQRVTELEERLRELPEKRERQAATERARWDGLRRLGEVRRRKSRLVERAARTLGEALGPRVRLAVRPMADRALLLGALEAALQGQGVRSDQLQRLALESPVAIGDAIRSG